MKEYNRKKRIYEDEKEKTGSLKKPKACRGGKPHDFVLLIPHYLGRNHNLSKDEIEEYYKLEQESINFNNEMNLKVLSLGIKSYKYTSNMHKFYKCSVCGKEKYEYLDLPKK